MHRGAKERREPLVPVERERIALVADGEDLGREVVFAARRKGEDEFGIENPFVEGLLRPQVPGPRGQLCCARDIEGCFLARRPGAVLHHAVAFHLPPPAVPSAACTPIGRRTARQQATATSVACRSHGSALSQPKEEEFATWPGRTSSTWDRLRSPMPIR